MKLKSGIKDENIIYLLDQKKAVGDADALLAHSMSRAKNITLGYFFHLSRKDVEHLSGKDILEKSKLISNSRYQLINAPRKDAGEDALIHAYAPETNLKSCRKPLLTAVISTLSPIATGDALVAFGY